MSQPISKSKNSIPIVTLQASNEFRAVLFDYVEKTEACFAIIIDRGGTILSQDGTIPDTTDTTIIAALAAGSFAATKELARRVGENEFSALYQQGGRTHILMSSIDDSSVLTTVFDTRTTVGLVRFYAERATKQIAAILEGLNSAKPSPCLFTEADVEQVTQLF